MFIMFVDHTGIVYQFLLICVCVVFYLEVGVLVCVCIYSCGGGRVSTQKAEGSTGLNLAHYVS